MKKAALLSVSDKSGLIELAQGLTDLGYVLLTSGGTGRHLTEAGLQVQSIEEYTGQAEILGGRVKTLHPKIHAGLLAKSSDPQHLAELEQAQIFPIEVAVVNLYPFQAGLKTDSAQDPNKMVELIDIGGPAMIRAAAKNHSSVIPLLDPADYPDVLECLRAGQVPSERRQQLASKVFVALAQYNLDIAKYFSAVSEDLSKIGELTPISGLVLERAQDLRYGENPHQSAVLYRELDSRGCWTQLHGKELSYNNLLDFDATLQIVSQFPGDPVAVIVKHLNPCGVALDSDICAALDRARAGDPRSHFGGVLGFNRKVNLSLAEKIREAFVEIVLAPGFEQDALSLLQRKKDLRLIQVELDRVGQATELRRIEGGILIQERDPGVFLGERSRSSLGSQTHGSGVGRIAVRLDGLFACEVECDCADQGKNAFICGCRADESRGLG